MSRFNPIHIKTSFHSTRENILPPWPDNQLQNGSQKNAPEYERKGMDERKTERLTLIRYASVCNGKNPCKASGEEGRWRVSRHLLEGFFVMSRGRLHLWIALENPLTLSSNDLGDMLGAWHWHALGHVLWFLRAIVEVNSWHRRKSKHGSEGI